MLFKMDFLSSENVPQIARKTKIEKSNFSF